MQGDAKGGRCAHPANGQSCEHDPGMVRRGNLLGAICSSCNGTIRPCPEHRRVDHAAGDDGPIFYCAGCVMDYGTAFGSIMHSCGFDRFIRAVQNITETDLERVIFG